MPERLEVLQQLLQCVLPPGGSRISLTAPLMQLHCMQAVQVRAYSAEYSTYANSSDCLLLCAFIRAAVAVCYDGAG